MTRKGNSFLSVLVLLASFGSPSPLLAGAGTEPRNVQTISPCTVLSKVGATYILQADVSSAATCFSVQADDVTLDLNHHTITYATESSPNPHYGVLAEACWDHAVAGNPCGGTADHLTISNGTITQGGGAAPRSHGIRIGQINRTNFLTVHDVTFSLNAPASIPIYTTFAGGGSQLRHNRFNNQVTTIADGHAIEGAP